MAKHKLSTYRKVWHETSENGYLDTAISQNLKFVINKITIRNEPTKGLPLYVSHKFGTWNYSLTQFVMWKDDFILLTRCGSCVLMLSSIDCSTHDSKSFIASPRICWSLAVSNLSWHTIKDLFNFSCIYIERGEPLRGYYWTFCNSV